MRGGGLHRKIGIVVVTSPARSHPSTAMLWGVLGSTASMIGGLRDAHVTVVCDGYRTDRHLDAAHASRVEAKLQRDPCCLSKKGIVRHDIASSYETFKDRLRREAAARRQELGGGISIVDLDTHHGFAMSVKRGLHEVAERGLPFSLVLQHDRAFIRPFAQADLSELLTEFERCPSLRYVGFPSSTSKRLATRLEPKYQLGALLRERSRPLRREGLRLRPLNFWYDSNHLVHTARALEIYEPYAHAPAWLRERLGTRRFRLLRLRRGDFIEDRFGTEQRSILCELAMDTDACLGAFDFFGSYLLEDTSALAGSNAAEAAGSDPESDAGDAAAPDDAAPSPDGAPALCDLIDSRGRTSYVAHIDARGATPRSWLSALPSLQAGSEADAASEEKEVG